MSRDLPDPHLVAVTHVPTTDREGFGEVTFTLGGGGSNIGIPLTMPNCVPFHNPLVLDNEDKGAAVPPFCIPIHQWTRPGT